MKNRFIILLFFIVGLNDLEAQNAFVYSTSIKTLDTNIRITSLTSSQLFDGIILGSEDGLYVCNYNDTNRYDTSNCNLTSNLITDVKNDFGTNNKLLVCNADGYSEFHESGGMLTLLTRLNSANSNLLSDTVSKIYPYNPYYMSDDFWISVQNHGAAHVQNGSAITNYTTSNSALPSNNVNNIVHGFITSQATTFCTDKGFAILENGQMSVYDTTNSSLPSNKVNSFVFAYGLNGIKWIVATSDKGLAIVDTSNTWVVLNTTNSVLPSDSILFIYKLTNQNFLLSTKRGLLDVDFSSINFTINNVVDTTDTYLSCTEVVFPIYCGFCNFHMAYSEHKIVEITTCVTDVNEMSENSSSKIYFANSFLKVESIPNDIYSIDVCDAMGKKVWTKTNQAIAGNTQYEINNLQSGIYVVNMKTKEGQLTKKVVLNGN